MTPERWQQIDDLFHQALGLPPEARPAFLDASCDGDADLRAEAEALLEADDRALSVLDASQDDLAALLPATDPAHVGPYRLLKKIGQGGMGVVYLAERADGQFSKQVALKLVRRGMDTEEILHRFRHERQILAALEHPLIARFYDGGVSDEGSPYLVMEYVDGRPIDRYCDDNTLNVDERLMLFTTVCEAIQYAHQNLIVHRDLKPSNILVTDAGQVKLLDFGIAKLLSDEDGVSTPMTRTGVRVMTPEYAAPEQIRGQTITTATDVYALGIVLYQLLTGRHPHERAGRSPLEAERLVLETDPERPSTAVTRSTERRLPGRTPDTISHQTVSALRATTAAQLQRRLRGDLDTILLKALQKEPDRRYHSADAFVNDVRRHLADLPVQARPDTMGYRARKFVQRHRFSVAAAAVFAVLLVGFAVAMALQQAATARERDRVRLEADKLRETKAFLVDLFRVSDPRVSLGETVTAHELLDRGAARIDEELAGQPEIQTEMMATLGTVYLMQGRYEDADTLLRQALQKRRALYGPAHPDIAQSLFDLASLFYYRGQYDQAETRYRDALAMHRVLPDESPLNLALTLNALGVNRYAQGDLDEAEVLLRQALTMRRSALGDEHLEIAKTLNNLASLLFAKGTYDEAERYAREALTMRRKLLGAIHPDLATSIAALAAHLHRKGDHDEALALFREALPMQRTLLGDDHPGVAYTIAGLASLLRDRGDYPAAETHYREALAIYHNRFGYTHPSSLYSLNGLGELLREQGRFEDAEHLLREGYEELQQAFGDHDTRTQSLLESLIALYEAWGKPDEAAAYRALLLEADG